MNDQLLIPEDMPVIDQSRLEMEFGGDKEILAELRDLFMEHAPPLLGHIKTAIRNRNSDLLAPSSVGLKVACFTYSAPRLAMICEEIKKNAKLKSWKDIDKLREQLVEEYDKVMEAVEKWESPE